ncbi:hypothetical protein PV328_010818 [Microctonus aethiopoides]|uniref:Uncharacterized protein n=1 Tax=Microctonus aethiopoides TaxID=144406 RepID=A0AA39FIK3_9HYME|nr:hypothetical protein PV328_010818 [Microctonus aethiopoides]
MNIPHLLVIYVNTHLRESYFEAINGPLYDLEKEMLILRMNYIFVNFKCEHIDFCEGLLDVNIVFDEWSLENIVDLLQLSRLSDNYFKRSSSTHRYSFTIEFKHEYNDIIHNL